MSKNTEDITIKVQDKSSYPKQTAFRIDPNQSYEVGFVSSTRNYLLLLNGLPTVRINELVSNAEGVRGLVTGLRDNAVEVLLLDDAKIAPNDQFFKTGQQLSIGTGEHLLGRVIDPLGIPIDGKGKFSSSGTELKVDKVATGIKSRLFIKNQFETGITTVDSLIPIAKGQRELVIGSARSGKSSFLIDTIINQRKTHENGNKGIICVIGLIGKPLGEIRRIVDILTINKAMEYTCIVVASSSDPASLILVAPSSAFTIAEYFQAQARDVLLILDDMGLHAKYYREMSLLSNKPPGRESYPGDIFSLHSSLVERAGNFRPEYGGGSITALPVIETSFTDFTAFIPTNLMAMTDGHLLFDADTYRRGIRPAINVSLSVSRVGRQTQTVVQKQLADKIKSTLAQAKRLETLSRFGSEVSEETQQTLNQGHQIELLLNQTSLTFIPKEIQIFALALIYTPFLAKKDITFLEKHKETIFKFLNKLDYKNIFIETSKMNDESQLITYMAKYQDQLEKACSTEVARKI